MRWLAAALSVAAAVSGCERPTYREPDPSPIEAPVPPPERVLRRPPDFRFTDFPTRRVFSYRVYTEALPDGGELKQEVVTVLDPGAAVEREATREEHDYVLAALEEDWLRKGFKERMEHHQELVRIARDRQKLMLEYKIAYAEKAIRHYEEEILVLEADLQASRKTAGYQAPPGRLEFLEREIAEKKAGMIETRASLATYRFLQQERDKAYGRSTRVGGN